MGLWGGGGELGCYSTVPGALWKDWERNRGVHVGKVTSAGLKKSPPSAGRKGEPCTPTLGSAMLKSGRTDRYRQSVSVIEMDLHIVKKMHVYLPYKP